MTPGPGATFTVRLFGPAREALGAPAVEVRIAGPVTAGGVVQALGRAHPVLSALLPRSRVAVNRAYVESTTPIDPGDEVAIIPPVGGG